MIKICEARYANEVLNKPVTVALMLPCPIQTLTRSELESTPRK